MKTFSIRERRKRRNKFGGTRVCKTEEVRKYFVNHKIEIQVFSYIICSLDLKNISCTLDEGCRFVVHIDSPSLTSSYCLCFISFSIFLYFFLVFDEFCYLLTYSGRFGDTKNTAVELFLDS